jgi:tetratricopeptide (TPR) repeat protein
MRSANAGRVVLTRHTKTGGSYVRDGLAGLSLFPTTGTLHYIYNNCDFVGFGSIDLKVVASRLSNSLAMNEHRKGKHEASAAAFSRAFELDPTWGQAAFNHACALALLGKWEKALGALTRAIDLDPQTFKAKAAKDKDLDGLRGNPQFLELLKAK